jgi:MFS family permease
MVVGAVLGALLVLSTLHLHDVGWREGVIAAVFVIAGATGVVLQPFIGRWSDRQGRLRPLRLSLAATIVLTLALAGLHGRWIVALLVTLALISVRGLIGPSLALLSDACDRTGLGQASALALSTVIGPAAFAVGAAGAGAIQDAASAAWGFAALAALLAVVRVAMSMRDHRRLRAQATGVT